MGVVTQNLGLVRAIEISMVPPINTAIIWYDDNVGQKIHKTYNTLTSTWEPLSQFAITPSSWVIKSSGPDGHRWKFTCGDDGMLIQPGEDLDV